MTDQTILGSCCKPSVKDNHWLTFLLCNIHTTDLERTQDTKNGLIHHTLGDDCSHHALDNTLPGL